MKSRAAMEALINDQKTEDLDMLIIQEPPINTFHKFVHHRVWRTYMPVHDGERSKIRSVIYVNRRISTSTHKQVACDSPDVVTIQVKTEETNILVASVYIQPIDFHLRLQNISARATLDAVETTIRNHKRGDDNNRPIILAGDFNRHHPLWSGRGVAKQMLEQSEELVNFIQTRGLHVGLEPGTPTFWSLARPGSKSTLDLTLTDTPERILKCKLYSEHYGSDHRAIYSEWDVQASVLPEVPPHRSLARTDWEKVAKNICGQMLPMGDIGTQRDLDEVVERLVKATQRGIDDHTPVARKSPYAKRWFTPELKAQQRESNKARREYQESCAQRGKNDAITHELHQIMRRKRREWTRSIERAKAAHWRQFLDDARAGGSLWKAASYMRQTPITTRIPDLRVDDNEYTSNADKASALLQSFFPRTMKPQQREIAEVANSIFWNPITKHEIKSALDATKAKKAPGLDGLPALVWKKLWNFISDIILRIFTCSVDLGYYPSIWKTATITVLRKPAKPDYTLPGAYRPISLLNTLGKLLEKVIARRLTYYTETHKLLPGTQYGGRPGRTTEQALLVLIDAIHRAWRNNKIVTLIAFDLKGAFNSANWESLDIRLEQKGIPIIARKWIKSFMQHRQANIRFDDFQSEVQSLEHAGLAQGSPLSPVLFTLFNADLVDQIPTQDSGASAFIDDYFRWQIGATEADNLHKIQSEDIPRTLAWAQSTGSEFAVEKTEVVHFTRRKKRQPRGEIMIGDAKIAVSSSAKLLGVVFDEELRFKEHVEKAVARATRASIAMGSLRHLRPAEMRQIYQACVTPTLDYASTVWFNPYGERDKLKALTSVQRTSLITILSSFRTVATQTLEVEAHVPPTRLRLQKRAQDSITNWYTLPRDHPIKPVLARAQYLISLTKRRKCHYLVEVLGKMKIGELQTLEIRDPRPLAPWGIKVFESIEISQNREQATKQLEEVLEDPSHVIYTDASARDSNLGAAAVILNHSHEVVESSKTSVGKAQHWTIHAAELIAIRCALNMAMQQHAQTVEQSRSVIFTIVSDSKSALQALAKPSNRSAQHIVHDIINKTAELASRNVGIRLLWTPSHVGTPGNDKADELARKAVGPSEDHPFQHLFSAQKRQNKDLMLQQWQHEWQTSTKGKHLRKIDDDLPSTRTIRLYGKMSRPRTRLLVQLRTGHNWLASFAKLFKFKDDDRCGCGASETVVHVLIDCPLLGEHRQQMREQIGTAFRQVSTMLGGRGNGTPGKGEAGVDGNVVIAVLDFAEKSERFCPRDIVENFSQRRQKATHRP